MKQTKGWCLYSGETPLLWNANFTRRGCIKDAIDWSGETWGWMKNHGYTCRKIVIHEAT